MTITIAEAFEGRRHKARKAFVPFVTAGHPDLQTTVRLVPELGRAGADIVEIGVPFSDPLADGPVIQRASERALRHGYRMADYLEAVAQIRRESEVPIVLFSYFNPILSYGMARLAEDANRAGVSGVLVTDMTPEEGSEYIACFRGHGIDTVFLAAPTSGPGRVERIARCSSGFVYVVSRTGVTGVQEALSRSLASTVSLVREHTRLPVAVGFGISRPEQVREVWRVADGAVVGSAIVAEVEKSGDSPELVQRVARFCRWLTGDSNGEAR